MTIRHIDDVTLRQPEVTLSTITVETFKWFCQEVKDLWMDKPNDKEGVRTYSLGIARYCVILTC